MNSPEKLTIRYTNLDTLHSTITVNGAFGALTHDGMLVVNLYFDRKSIPLSLEIEHIEHNIYGNEKPITNEYDADVIREVVSKICMTPKVAKNLGRWLIQKGEEAEQAMQGNV